MYNPDKKLLIANFFTPDSITVVPHTHARSNPLYKPLPLDEVGDIKEWNILLDQKYYDMTQIYTLNVFISKNTRDLVIDFKKYNEINKVDGNMLLKNILVQKFEHDIYENQLIKQN